VVVFAPSVVTELILKDWVPIITRDVQKQRRQEAQPPFSDAYLSGMPSKRRKLINSAKPDANIRQVISGE